MRKNIFQLLLYAGIIITNFNFTSCVTIGTALFAPSDEKVALAESELGLYQGWYQPKTQKAFIKLTLSNETMKTGSYLAVEEINTSTGTYVSVRLDTDKGPECVPVSYIVTTEIISGKKRKSKFEKMFTAVSIDFFLIGAALYLALPDWEFNIY